MFKWFVPGDQKTHGTTPAGFEPTRAEPSRFRIYRLNHSAKVPIDTARRVASSRTATLCHTLRRMRAACVAKWIRRAPPKGTIVGSSPIVGTPHGFFLRSLFFPVRRTLWPFLFLLSEGRGLLLVAVFFFFQSFFPARIEKILHTRKKRGAWGN